MSLGLRSVSKGLTHSAEDPRNLQDKVELGAPRNFAGALGRLQRLQLKLREEQRKTRVVVVRFADLVYARPFVGYVTQRSLKERLSKTRGSPSNYVPRVSGPRGLCDGASRMTSSLASDCPRGTPSV